MTAAQRRTLRARFMSVFGGGPDKRPERVHHGACVGADEDFHCICLAAGVPVETWPGDIPDLTAPCLGFAATHPPAPCIERNHSIVDACEVLIVAPAGYKEARQSGTWATFRYGVAQGKKVFLVWPDGRLEKAT